MFWGGQGEEKVTQGEIGGISEFFYVMYLIAAIKMAVCLVEIIDDDVSQNHCVSNFSSTKIIISSNLSQNILTRIVGY